MVVVTGGARGIGAAIAARFADDGCIVIAADLEPPAEGDPRVRYKQVDVSSPSDVGELFSRVTEDHHGVDVLVNNAGIWFRPPFTEISFEEWDQVFGVNVRGCSCAPKPSSGRCEQRAVARSSISGPKPG